MAIHKIQDGLKNFSYTLTKVSVNSIKLENGEYEKGRKWTVICGAISVLSLLHYKCTN